MTDKPKICVECKWHKYVGDEANFPWEYQRHFCYYPRGGFDLVTGEQMETPPRLCRYARAAGMEDDCGEAGQWWEPKPKEEEKTDDVHSTKDEN